MSWASIITEPITSTIPNHMKVTAHSSVPTAWLSAEVSSAPAQALAVIAVVTAITRAPFRTVAFPGRAWTGARGGRAGATGAGPAGRSAGRSAVSAARSAYVREASAWPTRASNSSLVSRS